DISCPGIRRAGVVEGRPNDHLRRRRRNRIPELISGMRRRVAERADEFTRVAVEQVRGASHFGEGCPHGDGVPHHRSRSPETAAGGRRGWGEGLTDGAGGPVETIRPAPTLLAVGGRTSDEIGTEGGERRAEAPGRQPLAECRRDRSPIEQVSGPAASQLYGVEGRADERTATNRRHRGAEVV